MAAPSSSSLPAARSSFGGSRAIRGAHCTRFLELSVSDKPSRQRLRACELPRTDAEFPSLDCGALCLDRRAPDSGHVPRAVCGASERRVLSSQARAAKLPSL
eukprot:13606540-Alexandrium_andersonii.AAC.1